MTKIVMALISGLAFMGACTNAPCRQLRHPELAAQQTQKTPHAPALSGPRPPDELVPHRPGAETAQQPMTGGTLGGGSASTNTTVFVYKPDGSLQCGAGKGASPQEMEKQLTNIKVFSRENRPDGLMHIQVCGSPTGMINIFEISVGDLPQAEKLGFKKFEPR